MSIKKLSIICPKCNKEVGIVEDKCELTTIFFLSIHDDSIGLICPASNSVVSVKSESWKGTQQ